MAAFKSRLNEKAEAPDDDLDLAEDDKARLFGARSVLGGIAACGGVELQRRRLDRARHVGHFPRGRLVEVVPRQGGQRPRRPIQLVVTLDAGDADIDLYSEIERPNRG